MPSSQRPLRTFYFENLDGLRFFCFLSVFFFHSFITDNLNIQHSPIYFFFRTTIFGNGFLGVNFFFVLSGFLITYLLIEEKKVKGFIHIPNFWMRRVLRIWPLYYACVFFGFVIFPVLKKLTGGVPTETANPWYYVSFLSNFDYIRKGQPDAIGLGVLWSVAVEEQFYLTWPIILSFFPVRKFWIPLTVILAISIVFRGLYDVPILHEMHTLSCIGDMAIGGIGAWLVIEKNSFKNKIYQLPKWFIVCMYISLLSVFLFRDEFLLSGFWLRVFERSFISGIMLFIILEQCFAQNSFYKMKNLKIPTRLGVITYGLYCLHFIVISATLGFTKWAGWNNKVWQVVLLETSLSLVISIVISLFSYRYFEQFFLRLKGNFSGGGKR
jgi:peptidoglycan/LPS O-acetylase OafA/YrhL